MEAHTKSIQGARVDEKVQKMLLGIVLCFYFLAVILYSVFQEPRKELPTVMPFLQGCRNFVNNPRRLKISYDFAYTLEAMGTFNGCGNAYFREARNESKDSYRGEYSQCR